MIRKKAYFFCTLGLALLACANASAAVQMNARGGFGNYFRHGSWLPIIVTVENFPDAAKPREKKDFRGSIEITCGRSNTQAWRFTRNIDVPTFSRKDFILYAHPDEPSVTVRLLDANDKAVIEQPLSGLAQLGVTQALVVVASAKTEPLYLPDLAGLGDYVRLTTVNPENLPDRWYGYGPVSLVVLSGYERNRMSESQQKALLNWVRSGGNLLVVGGAHTATYRGSFVEPFLPVKIRGTKTLQLWRKAKGSAKGQARGEREILVTDADLTENARVLWQQEGTVLLARRSCGVGDILFCAADLTDDSLSRHPDMLTAWVALFPFEALNNYERLLTPAFGDQLEMGLGGAEILPNLGIISFVMLGYVILVGPLNFFILWKRKRLELAWITVPVIVALFTAGIFIAGYATKGTEYIYRECNLVRLRAGEPSGVVHSAVGFFSPHKATYDVRTPSKESPLSGLHLTDNPRIWQLTGLSLFQRSQYAMAWQGRQPVPSMSIAYGAREIPGSVSFDSDMCSITGLHMGQWTMSIFDTASPITFPGAVEAQIVFDGARLRGKIVNNLPVTLNRSFIYFGGNSQPLDKTPIEPGKLLTVDLECTTGKRAISPQIFVPDLPHGDALSQQQMLLNDANKNTAGNCLGTLFYSTHWLGGMRPPHMSRAYLIGWGEEPYARLNFGPQVKRASALTLYMIELPVTLKTGTFAAGGHIPRYELTDEGQNQIYSSPSGATTPNISFSGYGYFTVASSLPYEEMNLRPDRIVARLQCQAIQAKLSAYNIKKREWDEIAMVGDRAEIRSPEDYVAPQNGRIFLKIMTHGPAQPAGASRPYYGPTFSSIDISYSGINKAEME
jgi:hypothetical protein